MAELRTALHEFAYDMDNDRPANYDENHGHQGGFFTAKLDLMEEEDERAAKVAEGVAEGDAGNYSRGLLEAVE